MAFHIEVSEGIGHARSFNLNAEELQRTVLDPWLSGRSILLGDRKWDPEESKLRILEGSELSNPELSFGQGWANAERGSEDVTGRLLESARDQRGGSGPAALVIETESAVQTVAELASTHQARSVDLESLSERLDGRDPEVAAVIVVIQR